MYLIRCFSCCLEIVCLKFLLLLLVVVFYTADCEIALDDHAPSVWSGAFDSAGSETDARALLADIDWPLDWLPSVRIEGLIKKSWWTLVDEIADRNIHNVERGLPDSTIPARALIRALQATLGLVPLQADKIHVLQLLRALGAQQTPEEWTSIFSEVVQTGSERNAIRFLGELDWPLSWLSAKEIEDIIAQGWWLLIDELVEKAVNGAHREEKEAVQTARLLDTVLRRVAASTSATTDLTHILRLVLALGMVLGSSVAKRSPEAWSKAFAAVTSQEQALALLQDHGWPAVWLSASEVESFVAKSWWRAAAETVRVAVREPYFQARADDVTLKTSNLVDEAVRKAVGSLRLKSEELLRALDSRASAAVLVHPAILWAQGANKVHLSVKYTERYNAPGALKVSNVSVNFNDTSFSFSGYGEHSGVRKHYVLDLRLYDALDPKSCSWRSASVGKMSVVLAKKQPAKWPRLLKDSAKVSNIKVWHDYQEKLEPELSGLE